MKSVLISIQPKWCELIASGKKTVEIRKTRPKIEAPFKVYIYQTRKPVAVSFSGTGRHISEYDRTYWYNERSGKVIGEFVCDSMTSLKADNVIQAYYNNTKETCLTDKEIMQYANNGKLYYWHISDLVIYDKPRELSEFETKRTVTTLTTEHNIEGIVHYPKKEIVFYKIIRPPQSWCYVERSDSNAE